jgi:hypothetical protein
MGAARSLAAFGLVAVILTTVAALGESLRQPTTALAAAPAPSADDWRPWMPPDGAFSVELPGRPVVTAEPGGLHHLDTRRAGATLGVAWAGTGDDPLVWLVARLGAGGGTPSSTSSTPAVVAGEPARSFLLTAPTGRTLRGWVVAAPSSPLAVYEDRAGGAPGPEADLDRVARSLRIRA